MILLGSTTTARECERERSSACSCSWLLESSSDDGGMVVLVVLGGEEEVCAVFVWRGVERRGEVSGDYVTRESLGWVGLGCFGLVWFVFVFSCCCLCFFVFLASSVDSPLSWPWMCRKRLTVNSHNDRDSQKLQNMGHGQSLVKNYSPSTTKQRNENGCKTSLSFRRNESRRNNLRRLTINEEK